MLSPHRKLGMLIQRMDNHDKNYNNGLVLADVKKGDHFWLVGNNVPIEFVEQRKSKIVFMQCCGWGEIEFDVDYFPRLIPTK